jgi:hypothetical protein
VVNRDLDTGWCRKSNLQSIRKKALPISKEVSRCRRCVKSPILNYVAVFHRVTFRLVVVALILWTVEPVGLFKVFCFSALGVFEFNAGIFCGIPNHVSVGMVAPSNEHRWDAPKAPGPSHKADSAYLIEIPSISYKVANFEFFHLALCRSVALSIGRLSQQNYSNFFERSLCMVRCRIELHQVWSRPEDRPVHREANPWSIPSACCGFKGLLNKALPSHHTQATFVALTYWTGEV